MYRGVLEKLGIHKDIGEVYEEFDKVYKASLRKEIKEKGKNTYRNILKPVHLI